MDARGWQANGYNVDYRLSPSILLQNETPYPRQGWIPAARVLFPEIRENRSRSWRTPRGD